MGPQSPGTLQSRMNLADRWVEAGRLDEAVTLQEDTLSTLRKVFGGNHRLTVMCMKRMAAIYAVAQRTDDAAKLNAELLTVRNLPNSLK